MFDTAEYFGVYEIFILNLNSSKFIGYSQDSHRKNKLKYKSSFE